MNENPIPLSLRVKRLKEGAKLPERGSSSAAGYDLFACIDEAVPIRPFERKLIPLGFAAAWNSDFYARIAPRSGLALKKGIHILAGVIDPDYRGEWAVILYNGGDEPFTVNPGDKIAQAVFERFAAWESVQWVDDLGETERGKNGYGSTGTR